VLLSGNEFHRTNLQLVDLAPYMADWDEAGELTDRTVEFRHVCAKAADLLALQSGDGRFGSLLLSFETRALRDTTNGALYDVLRWYANDATEHGIVVREGTDELVATFFDSEFFRCDPAFCVSGDTTRATLDQLDEDGMPGPDRFELVDRRDILQGHRARRRVLRGDGDPTLLSVAWNTHMGGDLNSVEALQRIAEDNTGRVE